MEKPTDQEVAAGCAAGRKALDDYSSWDSSMVPDAALKTFVTEILTAAKNVKPPQK